MNKKELNAKQDKCGNYDKMKERKKQMRDNYTIQVVEVLQKNIT